MIENGTYSTETAEQVTYDIVFETVCENNIECAKELQKLLFPVHYPDSFYNDLLCDPTKMSYVFRHAGCVIGICSVNVEVEHSRSYLMTFGVVPGYRRRRIGTQCLLLLESFLLEKYGIQRLYLHVLSSNVGAKLFYTKLGYCFLRIENDYYRNLPVKSALFFVKNIK